MLNPQDLAVECMPFIKDIVRSYITQGRADYKTWAINILSKQLPPAMQAEANVIGQAIFSGVDKFNERLASIQAAAAKGQTNEQWLKNELNKNIPAKEYGSKLQEAVPNLAEGNNILQKSADNPRGMVDINEEEAKNSNSADKTEWNKFSVVPLVNDFTKQAELTGLNAMNFAKSMTDEVPKNGENSLPKEATKQMSEGNIPSDMDKGLKVATSVALQLFVSHKNIPFLSKVLPAKNIVNIGCLGVEGAKCLWQLSQGKLNTTQAIEKMKKVSTAALVDIAMGTAPKLLAFIPAIGAPLSMCVTLALSFIPPEVAQEKLLQGINKLAGVSKNMAQGIMEMTQIVASRLKVSAARFFYMAEA